MLTSHPTEAAAISGPPLGLHGRHAVALELAAVRDGMTIIDWGCARGEFSAVLARALPASRIVACDIPYPDEPDTQDASNLEHHVLDERAPRLPLPDASVDRVFLLDVLEHTGPTSRRAALAEIRRVLAPQGRLVVTVPNRGHLHWLDVENVRFRWPRTHRLVFTQLRGSDLYRERYETFAHANFSSDAHRHHHYTQPELAAQLRAAGFHMERSVPFGVVLPVAWAGMLGVEVLQRLTGRPLVSLHRLAWRLSIRSFDARPGLSWADGLAQAARVA